MQQNVESLPVSTAHNTNSNQPKVLCDDPTVSGYVIVNDVANNQNESIIQDDYSEIVQDRPACSTVNEIQSDNENNMQSDIISGDDTDRDPNYEYDSSLSSSSSCSTYSSS